MEFETHESASFALLHRTKPFRGFSFSTLTETLLFLWIGKTTVCRIFSCQRSVEGLRPVELPCSLTRGAPKPRSAREGPRDTARGSNLQPEGLRPVELPCSLTRGAPKPLRRSRAAPSRLLGAQLSIRSVPSGIEPCLEAYGLPSPSPPPREIPGGRRLVENTGLEPVTSWLQTRRSPS